MLFQVVKIDFDKMTYNEILKLKLCKLTPMFNNLYKKSQVKRDFETISQHLNSIGFDAPTIKISTEWFSPTGYYSIYFPFYLLHPKLKYLQRRYVGEIEGKNSSQIKKYIRHECSHAIDSITNLKMNKKRQQLFGKVSKPYPKSYLPNFKNNNYVENLGYSYAQSHPEEDWAETFAIWINPKINWQVKYIDNEKCLKKIQLVHELFLEKTIKMKKINRNCSFYNICNDQRTIEEYLKEKRKENGIDKKKKILLKSIKSKKRFTNRKDLYLPIESKNELEYLKNSLKMKFDSNAIIPLLLKYKFHRVYM